MDLTDEPWAVLRAIIPVPPRRADGRGHPWRNPRAVLKGSSGSYAPGPNGRICPIGIHPLTRVIAASNSGCPGGPRPDPLRPGAGSPRAGRARSVRVLYRRHLRGGQKRGAGWERPSGARVRRSRPLQTGAGLPVAIHTTSTSPHEVILVEATLAARFLAARPARLIGDKVYDSDPLDACLAEEGVEMIAPHRTNRQAPPTQDGRPLRRYKRRRWL